MLMIPSNPPVVGAIPLEQQLTGKDCLGGSVQEPPGRRSWSWGTWKDIKKNHSNSQKDKKQVGKLTKNGKAP